MLNLLKKHYEKILLICTAKNWEHYREVQLKSSATLTELKKLQVIVDKHCPVLDDLTRKVQVEIDLKKM
jgi:hypothetical protein